MKQHILIFLLLFSVALIGQNTVVNSAKAKKEAVELFEIYEQKSENFNQTRQLDSMQFYLEKLNALLPILQDSSYNYRTDLFRGSVLIRNMKSDQAMDLLFKATEFFRLQKDYTNYYRGRYRIGNCYYYANRREDTQEIMLEILENKEYISEDMVVIVLEKIGAMNVELGMQQKDDALLQDAIKRFKKAISINQKNKDYDKLSSNYSLYAENMNQLDKKEVAIQLLDSSIYFAEKAKNPLEKGFALIKKGKILLERNQFNQAEIALNTAVDIYKASNDIPLLLYAYAEKKRMLNKTQKYKDASELADSIYSLTIVQYNERFADGISEMRTKYNTAEKEREILEQRTAIAEKEVLLINSQYQIYGALGLALVIFILGYLFYNQQKLKNRQLVRENKLKVALKEIEVQNKLQEQRLRISRDLHDNIGAQLSFIISSIDNLKYTSKNTSDEFQDKLSYISEFTSATIDQLRDTIWAMNKDEISSIDLQSRVLAFIEKAKMAQQQVKFEFDSEIESPVIFTAIEGMHLFRVVQESINNSLKYANATLIKVHFNETENQLILSIKDNGIGFKKETVQLGNGLYNMQKRMDEINATIDIHSEPSKGTEITVKYHL